MNIETLLRYSVERNASDLHISTGLKPLVRIDGDLEYTDNAALSAETTLALIHSTMNERQKAIFQESYESDYSFTVPGVGRFRVNAFQQYRGPAAVFRTIPSKVVTLDQINAPPIFKDIANLPRGLVLVTGPTGSGKSTTLAAMVDYVNTHQKGHILTIEDPIEFLHESK